MADTTDSELLKQIKEYAQELETSANSKDGRNSVLKGMEDIYFMRSYEEGRLAEREPNLKLTRSPTARNSVKGMERLLIASDPVINVPYDINGNLSKNDAESIENFCKAMWFASGRIGGDPIHYDAVRSGLVYSIVIIAVKSVKQILDNTAEGGKKRRLEYIRSRTPYLFEVWNPKTCYFESDLTGITSICRKIKARAGAVESAYGSHVREQVMKANHSKEFNRFAEIDLAEYYDEDNHAVWIEGADGSVLMEKVDTHTIPIAAQVVEGSKLWEDAKAVVEPPLYTLWRSQLIDRENLTLSMLFTYIFNVGANPMFNEFLNDPTNAPEVDYSQPGYRIRYMANERVEPAQKQAVDPSMMQGWELSRDLGTQSTIYPQTLGEPLGKNAPYSMVALLSQAGRLPLTVVQRKVSWCISDALEIALRWARQSSDKQSAAYEENVVQLDPKIIPETISVQAKLEIELPQDRLQAANAAAVLTQGERPIVSNEWVRTNILNISGSKAMDAAIYNEQARALFHRRFMIQQLAQIKQMEDMAMQPPMPQQGQMPPGMPPPGMEGMPPPGMEGMPPTGAGMPGMEGEPMQQPPPFGGRFPEGVQPMPPYMPFPGMSPMPPTE